MSDQKSESVHRMSAADTDGAVMDAEDLTDFVQNLLQQMHSRFQGMSDSIIGRLDEMGDRLNDLERSIEDLMTQCEVDEAGAGEADENNEEETNSADKND